MRADLPGGHTQAGVSCGGGAGRVGEVDNTEESILKLGKFW